MQVSSAKHSVCRCPKATLTFWEGLELAAVLQVELLQVSELSSTCQTIAESANSTVRLRAEARSPRYADARRVTLTFWKGLKLEATPQVELLQVAELSCACQIIA